MLVQNEWTTKKSKNKKKVTQPPSSKVPAADTIIAPGDSHSSGDREGTRSYGGTSKAGEIFKLFTKIVKSRVQLLNVFHDSVVCGLFVANVVLRCLLKASCFVASKSTRENYGGSVSVERVDREQRGSKNYGRNTSRGFRDRGSSGDRGRLRRR